MNEPQAPDWRIWIQQGAKDFREGRSAEAISSFEKACELSPETAALHLYLAIALHQRYIPGAVSTENAENAELGRRAEMELQRAWDLDPQGWIAALLGQFALSERRFADAREWYEKALTQQPNNAEIWCTLGYIAWQEGLLDEAIANFEKSVNLDPLQADAMEYLGRMTGGDWLERSYDARSERLQASFAGTESVASDSGDPAGWLLKMWARVAVLPPPPPSPPPPPPPPPSMAVTGRRTRSSATISWEPWIRAANEAPPIRVAPDVQATKLIGKVDADAPADWPHEPPMRFAVVIGNDGRIIREVLISGNLWLAQSAIAALREWVYEPTLIDGKSVAVVTEVRIGFKRRL